MKKINIILPVYCESEVIEEFHHSLNNVINKLSKSYVFEVIYVLDKSTDDSEEKLKNICKHYDNVSLLVLSRRFGHQHSLVAGMDKCEGDAIIMMDSDFEHPPEIIPLLLEKYEQGYDIVNTKRTYNIRTSYIKKLSSRIFYKLFSAMVPIKANEDSADYRLITKRVLEVFKKNIREQNQFLRGLFSWVGFNQSCVTFVSEKRKYGKSKYNFLRLFNFGITGIISFTKIPLRISLLIGLIIFCLCGAYGLYCIIQYIINENIPKGWTSIIVVILFLNGLQFILLGVMGEYIGSIFDEVKKRPLYIIEQEYRCKSVTK